jgi:hypothetical protein
MRQGVRVMMLLLLLLLLLSPLLLLLLVMMMLLLLIEQMTAAQITGCSDHLVRWSQRARNQSARSDNCQKTKQSKIKISDRDKNVFQNPNESNRQTISVWKILSNLCRSHQSKNKRFPRVSYFLK